MVRSRFDRLKRASNYIIGFLRMGWLSKYFQLLRKSARMIQRFWRQKNFQKDQIR